MISGAALTAEALDKKSSDPARRIELGSVWAGVGTEIGTAASRDGTIFAAYYGPDRNLTISALAPGSQAARHKPLASRFGGWDGHNAVVMAISNDQVIHIAGNMHGSPLVYASGPSSRIDKVNLSPMTGSDEDKVTYPKFMFDQARNLLFIYRNGGAGNGAWFVNRWEGGRWKRLSSPFSATNGKASISAYPSDFVKDRNGVFHVAIVWRRGPDVSSNFALSYASTRDFVSWQIGKDVVKAPLRPDTTETVDEVGEGRGLANNAKVFLFDDKPVIVYTKLNKFGRNAIFISTRKEQWVSREVYTYDSLKRVSGKGSVPDLPSAYFSGEQKNGSAKLIVRNTADGSKSTWVDMGSEFGASSRFSGHDKQPSAQPFDIPSGMKNARVRVEAVRQNGVDGDVVGQLQWFAQEADHDRPIECTTNAPRACSPPPSPLIWYRK